MGFRFVCSLVLVTAAFFAVEHYLTRKPKPSAATGGTERRMRDVAGSKVDTPCYASTTTHTKDSTKGTVRPASQGQCPQEPGCKCTLSCTTTTTAAATTAAATTAAVTTTAATTAAATTPAATTAAATTAAATTAAATTAAATTDAGTTAAATTDAATTAAATTAAATTAAATTAATTTAATTTAAATTAATTTAAAATAATTTAAATTDATTTAATTTAATTTAATTTAATTTAATTTAGAIDGGPRNCEEVHASGGTTSGVYSVYPDGQKEVRVYCEQTLRGGGWTVFQRRIDGSVNFYLYWADYKAGFGDPSGEYWVGNDDLHTLTANMDTQLLVELQHGGETQYAQYTEFWVLGEDQNYHLHVSGYSGGDPPGDSLTTNDGAVFTTRDRDNDEWPYGNCASGGWWYKWCTFSNLNGLYGNNTLSGMTWHMWKGCCTSLTAARMLLKTK